MYLPHRGRVHTESLLLFVFPNARRRAAVKPRPGGNAGALRRVYRNRLE
jgi:hypothetical protein